MRLGNCEVDLLPGSKIHELYGSDKIVERHRHRYEVNPEVIEDIEKAGMKIKRESMMI